MNFRNCYVSSNCSKQRGHTHWARKHNYKHKLVRGVNSLSPLYHGINILFLMLLLFTSSPLHAELSDMIVARVNDNIILLSDIRIRMTQTLGAEKLKALDKKTREGLEKRILEQMVEEKILAAHALKLGINVDETLIEQNIEAIKKSNKMADWQLEEALKKEGITMEEYQNILKEQRLISIVINREVSSKVFIEEGDIKEYYAANVERFTTGAEIHVKHIFLKKPPKDSPDLEKKARARLTDILGRLRGGENFSRLAKLYSEDTTAQAGGDLGFFARGKMVPSFEDAAFHLKVGEISEIIATDFGFHIIKCVEKKDERVLNYEEAKELAKKRLYAEKAREKKERLMDKLKKDANVEIKI